MRNRKKGSVTAFWRYLKPFVNFVSDEQLKQKGLPRKGACDALSRAVLPVHHRKPDFIRYEKES